MNLTPDSFSQVFLDESNNVKLGDFGLSKALVQASFANTYVGVRSVTFLRKRKQLTFV